MNAFFNIIAKILSLVFYPLFVPTYGIALFCYVWSVQAIQPVPRVWTAIAVTGTLVFTCVLPISAIWIMMQRGKVKDMQIADSRERTMPYVYTLCGFAFWSYLMVAVLKAPIYLGLVCVGAIVAIGIVMLVNKYWKISAHLTGIGGFFGGLMSYFLGVGNVPSWGTLSLCLIVSLLLMCSRVYLKAHTSAQVCAGWLLGLACTFLPYYIVFYAG